MLEKLYTSPPETVVFMAILAIIMLVGSRIWHNAAQVKLERMQFEQDLILHPYSKELRRNYKHWKIQNNEEDTITISADEHNAGFRSRG